MATEHQEYIGKAYRVDLPETCPECGKDGMRMVWVHSVEFYGPGMRCASCGATYYLYHREEHWVRISEKMTDVHLHETGADGWVLDDSATADISYYVENRVSKEKVQFPKAKAEHLLRIAPFYTGAMDGGGSQVDQVLFRDYGALVDLVAWHRHGVWELIPQKEKRSALRTLRHGKYDPKDI